MGSVRRRAPARRSPGALDHFVRVGPVAALGGYFAQRLKLAAGIAFLIAAALTGWHLFGHSAPRAVVAGDALLAPKVAPLPPARVASLDPPHAPPVAPAAPVPASRPDAIAALLGRAAGVGGGSAPLAAARDAGLDAWFVKAYLRCWSPPTTLPQGEPYAAQVRVTHNPDGSITAPPVLINPPSDPEWRPFAESAVRAVEKCAPLAVPQQYAARFAQWKKMSLHFTPDAAAD